jgi:hypothetical protein
MVFVETAKIQYIFYAIIGYISGLIINKSQNVENNDK